MTTMVATETDAMERWDALSMLESGNDDAAVGAKGEVSRYQIMPALWPPGRNRKDKADALRVALSIMQHRVERFIEIRGRLPNDFEFYVLWNAPEYIYHHPNAIPECVQEKAFRFVNLCNQNFYEKHENRTRN